MCEVCKYIIFRIQQEFDLAMAQFERDKVDTLGSLLADAHIALWEQKEGVAYQPTIDEALDQALGVIVAGPGAGKSLREKHEAEKEADREAERQELWQPGDEPYEPDYWGAHYE